MQKLLIVIAIQFCLPWLALLMEFLIPYQLSSHFDDHCVLIQLAVVGSIIGLLRPQWTLMLLSAGALCCYCFVWNMVYAHRYQRTFNDSAYIQYQFLIALTMFVLNSILSTFLEIDVAPRNYSPRKKLWQHDIRHLLYLVSVIAMLAAVLSARPRYLEICLTEVLVFQIVQVCSATIIFYCLLWHSWSWRRMVLALSASGITLWVLRVSHHFESKVLVMSHLVFILLAVVTSLLYRFSGLRISWRLSLDRAKSSSLVEQL